MSKPVFIPDEWLMSYAAGSLPEAHALIVASHAWYHPEVRSRIADAEAVGGALMETAEVADMSAGALDAVLARLDEPLAEDESPVQTVADSDMPAPLAEWLGKGWGDLKWKFMGPGLSRLPLKTGPDGEKLWLLRAKPGANIPIHDHGGLEMTLILKGSYSVEGTRFGPGSMEVADAETLDHQPVIGDEEECICLVVTEAPIRPHSLMGRLFQPFIGL
jgi:putative transcriptional regulator